MQCFWKKQGSEYGILLEAELRSKGRRVGEARQSREGSQHRFLQRASHHAGHLGLNPAGPLHALELSHQREKGVGVFIHQFKSIIG